LRSGYFAKLDRLLREKPHFTVSEVNGDTCVHPACLAVQVCPGPRFHAGGGEGGEGEKVWTFIPLVEFQIKTSNNTASFFPF